MHSKVCGLCGNYNGKPGDDFELQHGGRTSRAEEFVESWRAGGVKSCTRNVQSHQPSFRMVGGGGSASTALAQRQESAAGCSASSKKHHRDYRKCMPIRSDIFKKCHIVVPAMRYYKWVPFANSILISWPEKSQSRWSFIVMFMTYCVIIAFKIIQKIPARHKLHTFFAFKWQKLSLMSNLKNMHIIYVSKNQKSDDVNYRQMSDVLILWVLTLEIS